MSYPIFSWRPHQYDEWTVFDADYRAGDRVYLDLEDYGEQLSDLQVTPMRDVSDTFAIGGGRSRSMTRAWMNVRILIDRFKHRDLFRRLSTMINHLERGGTVSFSNDKSKCFLARCMDKTYPWDDDIYVGPNLCKKYSTTEISGLNVGTNDEIVIEQQPPFAKRWHGVITARGTLGADGSATYTVGRITAGGTAVSTDINEEFRAGDHIRYADFWPTLVLPKSQVGAATLTHDHRITYTLDLNLQYVIPYRNIWHPEGL